MNMFSKYCWSSTLQISHLEDVSRTLFTVCEPWHLAKDYKRAQSAALTEDPRLTHSNPGVQQDGESPEQEPVSPKWDVHSTVLLTLGLLSMAALLPVISLYAIKGWYVLRAGNCLFPTMKVLEELMKNCSRAPHEFLRGLKNSKPDLQNFGQVNR